MDNELKSFLELENYEQILKGMTYVPNSKFKVDIKRPLITINDKSIRNCNINILISRKYKYGDNAINTQKVLEKYTCVAHIKETGGDNIINVALSPDDKIYIYLDNFKYYESED